MRLQLHNCRDCARRLRNGLLILLFGVIIFICQMKTLQQREVINIIMNSDVQYLFAVHDNTTTETNLSKIENIILEINEEERVLNEDTFGPINKNTNIIVIIMNNYSVHLKFMLYSLSQVKGIGDALLIFSHSNYDENANILIKTIDFCRVLQIFYPHSVQLHPDKFPGFSSDDCTLGMPIAATEVKNCTSRHYRDPRSSEKKHHWWWTANQVFESLTTTENHVGTVVFVHDDYFFLEDFLYMTDFMKDLAGTMSGLSGYEFLSLGSLPETDETGSLQRAVEVVSWEPALHAGVLAFDHVVWNNIVSHYDLFCQIDDYSWSQSLSYLSLNRKDSSRYKVMASLFPRAYKLSQCLYLGKILGCGIYSSVHQIMTLQRSNYHELFPPYIEVFVDIELEDEDPDFDFNASNDPRDKELCSNLTITNKIKRV